MASNMVVINERIKFKIDDAGMNQLISLLDKTGSLVLDCNWCGLTILPQVKNQFASTMETEIKAVCVGCGKTVDVRMYGQYGFLLNSG